MSRVALIDGDNLIYSVGFSTQHTFYELYNKGELYLTFDYSKQLWDFIEGCSQEFLDASEVRERVEVEPVSHAFHSLDEMINSIMKKVSGVEYIIYYGGKDNFREQIATIQKYKGNRNPDQRPIYYEELKLRLKSKYGAIQAQGQEADDELGIKFTELRNKGLDCILCTKDKDLNMIPGLHFNMNNDKIFNVTEEEAIKFFYTQMLTGDTVDNIRGCKGIGPKIAQRLLKDLTTEEEMYAVVLESYKKCYEDKAEEALLETGRLLWIRKQADQMWVPPV